MNPQLGLRFLLFMGTEKRFTEALPDYPPFVDIRRDGYLYQPRISEAKHDPQRLVYLICSEQDEWALCGRLYREIVASGEEFDMLLALKRGGAYPGRLLAQALGLPVDFLWLRRYGDVGEGGEVKVIEEPAMDLRGRRLLRVDDVNDQGVSFLYADDFERRCGAVSSRSVVMHQKPWTRRPADHVADVTRAWVVYLSRELPEFVALKLAKAWSGRPIRGNIQTLVNIRLTPDEICSTLAQHEQMAAALDYLGTPYSARDFQVWEEIAHEMLDEEF